MAVQKILFVVTGTDAFAGRNLPTGLWLSEFTHPYHCARERGLEITVANPKGGKTPVDPVSLKPIFRDKLSEKYWKTPAFRDMLDDAESLDEVSGQVFDCIYLAGGHGAMYDFPDNAILQEMLKEQYESQGIVAAICHGVCGLLNVRLSGGEYLPKGRKITGFSWFEERLAHRKRAVPFNLEAALKERGADYRKALVPMLPKVVVDRQLITGQDPFSSERMAQVVMRRLHAKACNTQL